MNHLFKKAAHDDFVCDSWLERDRANLSLATPKGRIVFDLWDDDVLQAIEDGFLQVPRVPRPTDADWKEAALDFAVTTGLATKPC